MDKNTPIPSPLKGTDTLQNVPFSPIPMNIKHREDKEKNPKFENEKKEEKKRSGSSTNI